MPVHCVLGELSAEHCCPSRMLIDKVECAILSCFVANVLAHKQTYQ